MAPSSVKFCAKFYAKFYSKSYAKFRSRFYKKSRKLFRGLPLLAAICLAGQNAGAQTPAAAPRVLQPINETQLTVLRGNTHPMARAAYDRGAADPRQPVEHVQILLQRTPDQEAALQALLARQQDATSPDFHHWLSPDEFGRQFGPADQDVQAVAQWLTSHGLSVESVNKGRTVIQFSGNAGQMQQAFHTQIHLYTVNGEEHWANAEDPQIPTDLAPVVAGIASLHNFRKRAMITGTQPYRGPVPGRPVAPQFTDPTGLFNGVGPTDFATIYNVLGLWNAATPIDGTGETVAIVARSNISLDDVRNFRMLFGLPANDPQVVLAGPDPGLVSGDETEAILDVERVGSVAKNATVLIVVGESTDSSASDGVDLSSIYIVDNDLAPVMSASFGECELFLGTGGNAFENALWQQAAAQGITVVVSTGDNGSAGCDNEDVETVATMGLAVNGLASTPYNVAVGGTDFDDAATQSQFWSPTNDPVTQNSAKSYIPEVPWNDTCAASGLSSCIASESSFDLVAGSGGPSSMYPKPSWQTGTGVPADGHRDLPDVSLFAGNGLAGAFYVICESDLTGPGCTANLFGSLTPIGGTSAAAPSFAGIMVLVNQLTHSRQGNPNYVLYKLAAKPGNTCSSSDPGSITNPACVFYDVTKGNNSVACQGTTKNCSSKSSANGVLVDPSSTSTEAWISTPGYDRATGLGSLNVTNLANQWSSITFTQSSTSLSLSSTPATNPLVITHGQSVTANVGVTPGSPAPTGSVSLSAAQPGGTILFDALTLNAGGSASSTTTMLPGGASYNVTAHYGGDGTYGQSDSQPVVVTVNPEGSITAASIVTFSPNTGAITSNNATTFVYGSPYILRVDVTAGSGIPCFNTATFTVSYACPTGKVAVTDNGMPLDAGTFALNARGFLEDQPIQLPAGTHTLLATYNGDSSYTTSTSSVDIVTVTPAATVTIPAFNTASTALVGNPVNISVQVVSESFSGVAPTGTITFFDGATQLSGPVTLTGQASSSTLPASLTGTITTTFSTSGTHAVTAHYSGDMNYNGSISSNPNNVAVLFPTTVAALSSAASITFGQSVTITGTATASASGPPMTGQFTFNSPSGPISGSAAPTLSKDMNGNQILTANVTVTPQSGGFFSAFYTGDSNYQSGQNSISVGVMIPDFSFGPGMPAVSAPVGQPAMLPITITPAGNMASTVMLTCIGPVPVGYTCTIQPPAVSLANGVAATATLMLTPQSGASSSAARRPAAVPIRWDVAPPGPQLLGLLGILGGAAALVILARSSRKQWRVVAVLGLACALSWMNGCGGGTTSNSGTPAPQNRAASTTTLTVSPSSIVQGTTAMLTATVTGQGVPSGIVNFLVNGNNVSSANLAGGSATVAEVFSTVGIYSLKAVYGGDSANQASSSALLTQNITGNISVLVQGQTGGLIHNVQVSVTLQ